MIGCFGTNGCRDTLRTPLLTARTYELEWPGLFRLAELTGHHLLREGVSSLHRGLPEWRSKGEFESLSVSEEEEARGAADKNNGEGEAAREWEGEVLAVEAMEDLPDLSCNGSRKSEERSREWGVWKVVAGEWRLR